MFVRPLAILVAICLLPLPLLSQDCVEYLGQDMRILDSMVFPDYVGPYCVEAAGDVAVVGTSGGVYTVDVSDPENMALLGSYSHFGCLDLAIIGDLVCVSCQNDEILFVDISDPGNITHVKTIPDDGERAP